MRKARFYVLLLSTAALAFVLPAAVAACTTDADCDNGDYCTVADVCDQSNMCVLGGGGDKDANLICDDEFDPMSTMRVTKLVVKSHLAAGPTKSVVHGTGDFIDNLQSGPFSKDDGIAIRAKDQLSSTPDPDGVDVTVAFGAQDCAGTSDSFRCSLLTGAHLGSRATFKRNLLAPEQIKFSFVLREFPPTQPYFGPLRVVLTYGNQVHRPGVIIDCKLTPTGVRCREF
jgi:hypothetical protein